MGKSKSKARSIAKTVLVSTVATRTEDTHGPELMPLTLALAPRYASLASERGGFSATVTVTFSAPGHATLIETIPVTFARVKKKSSKKRSPKNKSKSRHKRDTGKVSTSDSSSNAGGCG